MFQIYQFVTYTGFVQSGKVVENILVSADVRECRGIWVECQGNILSGFSKGFMVGLYTGGMEVRKKSVSPISNNCRNNFVGCFHKNAVLIKNVFDKVNPRVGVCQGNSYEIHVFARENQ